MLALCLIAGSAGDFALSTSVYNPANLYAQFIATLGMFPFPLAFSAAGVLFFCACDRKRVPSFVFYLCFGIALNAATLLVMGSEFWSNLGVFMQQGQEVPLYATGPVFFACISALPICIFDLWLFRICEDVEKKRILRVPWFVYFAVTVFLIGIYLFFKNELPEKNLK